MSAPAMLRPLSELIEDAKPGFACGEEDPDGIFQLRMNNIRRDGTLDFSKQRRVPRARKSIESTFLRAGDVLFNATNSPDLVGKTALIRDVHEPTVYSNHFIRLRTNSKVLDPAYLARWLSWQFQLGTFKSICKQWVNQATVGKNSLLNLSIPLLSMDEQRRIAELLSQADELQTKRRQAIALLDDLAQSIFLNMFGSDRTPTIGQLTLEEACIRITDGTHQSPKWSETGNPFIFISNITSGEINFNTSKFISDETHHELTKRCPIEIGDILYSTVGSYGIPVIVNDPRKFAFQRHIAHIKPNRKVVNPYYLREVLASPLVRLQADHRVRGVAQKTINLADIKKFVIPVPDLANQDAFVSVTRPLSTQKVRMKAQLTEMESLFASLQARAFRGEL